jgi:hypothetical protein
MLTPTNMRLNPATATTLSTSRGPSFSMPPTAPYVIKKPTNAKMLPMFFSLTNDHNQFAFYFAVFVIVVGLHNLVHAVIVAILDEARLHTVYGRGNLCTPVVAIIV